MRMRLAIAALPALLASACVLGPKYQTPAPPQVNAANYKESPVNFQDADGWKVASPQDAMLRGKWWTVFNEPELNALEDKLEIGNQTLQQYFENFMEARALVAEARAGYWPTVSLDANLTKAGGGSGSGNTGNAGAGTGTIGTTPAASTTTTGGGGRGGYELALDLSWEPDLWGKIRNEVRAAESGAQVGAADLENERLTEEAALAEYFFELRGQDALQQILNQTVAADQNALRLTEASYQAGIDTEIAVVEARTTLETAEAQAAGAGVERAEYEHAIALLLGQPATDFSLPVRAAEYTPPAIPTGVPSELVERRPDIAAAERTLEQNNAEIGVGYGAFFPDVTLDATAGFESSAIGKLISLPSRFWSIGPSATQTLFNGGLYRAELDQYIATYNANLAVYRQTVLTAFEQVEDYLAAVRIYSDEIERQTAAVKDAQQFLNMELARYRTGIDPYVDVLTAQTTLLNSQETLAGVQVESMTSAVQLVQALGGGWDKSQLPGPREMDKKPAAGDYKIGH